MEPPDTDSVREAPLRVARHLVFLGRVDAAALRARPAPAPLHGGDEALPPSASPFTDGELPELTRASGEPLRAEGRVVASGDRLKLLRRRSPWSHLRPQVRIIIGTHPGRADLLLEGDGLAREHLRLYLSRRDGATNDLKALRENTVWVNDQVVGHEWCALADGDRLDLGPWSFRFELEDQASV